MNSFYFIGVVVLLSTCVLTQRPPTSGNSSGGKGVRPIPNADTGKDGSDGENSPGGGRPIHGQGPSTGKGPGIEGGEGGMPKPGTGTAKVPGTEGGEGGMPKPGTGTAKGPGTSGEGGGMPKPGSGTAKGPETRPEAGGGEGDKPKPSDTGKEQHPVGSGGGVESHPGQGTHLEAGDGIDRPNQGHIPITGKETPSGKEAPPSAGEKQSPPLHHSEKTPPTPGVKPSFEEEPQTPPGGKPAVSKGEKPTVPHGDMPSTENKPVPGRRPTNHTGPVLRPVGGGGGFGPHPGPNTDKEKAEVLTVCQQNVTCTLCIRMNGFCRSNGSYEECCRNKTTSIFPQMLCRSTNGTCGKDCTDAGDLCLGNKCCPKKRTLVDCKPTNGVCGTNCTLKDGQCVGRDCCSNKKEIDGPDVGCKPINGECSTNCTLKDGLCVGRNCCPNDTEIDDPLRHCKPNGTCGMKCTAMGGVCIRNRCCPGKRPPVGCKPINDVCGNNCTLKDGLCVGRNCCSNETENDGPRMHCRPEGTCGNECRKQHGTCIKNKCCVRKQNKDPYNGNTHPGDKDVFKGKEHDDDDDSMTSDDHSGSEANTECQRERRLQAKRAKLTSVGSRTDIVRVNCTSRGLFLARCHGNDCHCLNAATGKEHGKPKRVASFERINCDEVQRNTTPEMINVTVKVSDRDISTFNSNELNEIESQLEYKVEEMHKNVEAKARVFSGSVRAEIKIKMCSSSDCTTAEHTMDLHSVASNVVSEIQQGSVVLEVSGQTFKLSNAAISTITTTAMLEALETDVENKLKETDDNMETVIIAVVVVAIVGLLMSVGVACYCYSKNNKLLMKQAFFNNAQAKENPGYMKSKEQDADIAKY